jgi:hypothetical protein
LERLITSFFSFSGVLYDNGIDFIHSSFAAGVVQADLISPVKVLKVVDPSLLQL